MEENTQLGGTSANALYVSVIVIKPHSSRWPHLCLQALGSCPSRESLSPSAAGPCAPLPSCMFKVIIQCFFPSPFLPSLIFFIFFYFLPRWFHQHTKILLLCCFSHLKKKSTLRSSFSCQWLAYISLLPFATKSLKVLSLLTDFSSPFSILSSAYPAQSSGHTNALRLLLSRSLRTSAVLGPSSLKPALKQLQPSWRCPLFYAFSVLDSQDTTVSWFPVCLTGHTSGSFLGPFSLPLLMNDRRSRGSVLGPPCPFLLSSLVAYNLMGLISIL